MTNDQVLLLVLGLAWCPSGCAAGFARVPRAEIEPQDSRAVGALVQAWSEAAQAGELAPLKGECLIEKARVVHTNTAAEFSRECTGFPVTAASSCASQESHQVGLVVYAVPRVVLRPGQPSIGPTGQSAVVHELIHHGSACVLKQPGSGLNAQDPGHRDPRLWVVASQDKQTQALSVEGRAWRLLRPSPALE